MICIFPLSFSHLVQQENLPRRHQARHNLHASPLAVADFVHAPCSIDTVKVDPRQPLRVPGILARLRLTQECPAADPDVPVTCARL